MKKLGLLVMPLMAVSLLASCGNKEEPKDEEYEVTFSVPVREDTILYGDKTQTVKWGEAPIKPKKDPYRVGYKFTGWYKDEKCSKIFDFQKDRIKGITTLYSGWEEDPKFTIPLCFTSNTDGNTILTREGFYYKTSLNGEWVPGDDTTSLTFGKDEKVYIGSDNAYSRYYPPNFSLPSASFNASGNIMSLINHENFKFLCEVDDYQFDYLFSGSNDRPSHVVDAGDLLLPATKLADYCYRFMFDTCTELVRTPQLPAITLAYECYRYMFDDCESLTKAPELPATTLDDYCYESMFYGCTKLVEVPELPVTELTEACYKYMFYGCESLTKAPELPATTLLDDCYYGMFVECKNINYIKVGFDDGTDGWPKAKECTDFWLDGVSATGTFVWRGSSEGPSTRGIDTVPEGWTIETY